MPAKWVYSKERSCMSLMASRCGRLLANAGASATVLHNARAQLAAPSKKAIILMKPGLSLAALEVSATWYQKRWLRSSSTIVMCSSKTAPAPSGPRLPSGPSKATTGIGVWRSPAMSPKSLSLAASGGNTCSVGAGMVTTPFGRLTLAEGAQVTPRAVGHRITTPLSRSAAEDPYTFAHGRIVGIRRHCVKSNGSRSYVGLRNGYDRAPPVEGRGEGRQDRVRNRLRGAGGRLSRSAAHPGWAAAHGRPGEVPTLRGLPATPGHARPGHLLRPSRHWRIGESGT